MWQKPLLRSNKAAARGLLYGLAALLVVLLVWGPGWVRKINHFEIDTEWLDTDWTQVESVQLFREYLRIDTSAPDGNEVPGAEFLAAQLEAVGIETHIERIGDRNANLWAILEGEEPGALVLHNHIDVDPIRYPEMWTKDPFGAEIEGPWVFGRGAFDMKSVTIAQLMALIELKRSGHKPKRSIIFLATGDEETDSWLGTRWVLKNHPELVERFDLVLTEGGAVEATDSKEVVYWGTEFAQRRYVEVFFCHQNRDRLEALSEDLDLYDSEQLEWQLTPVVEQFFDAYAEHRRFPHQRTVLRDPRVAFPTLEYDSLPPYLRSMLRNEAHQFPIVELADGTFELRVSLHLLPGVELEDAWDQLLPPALVHDVPRRIEEAHPVVEPTPADHPLFEMLAGMIEERWPGTSSGPLFVPRNATDARFFRNAGIATYGFSPFLILSVDTLQMTGANERMALPAFVDGVDLYVELVRQLADGKDREIAAQRAAAQP